MATMVQVNKRGSLTLPAEVRRHFNLQADDLLMVEKTPEGILLRRAQAVPLVQFGQPDREGMRKVVAELAELCEGRT
jgi:AbrB family looped-hinge helix DNA binding protein